MKRKKLFVRVLCLLVVLSFSTTTALGDIFYLSELETPPIRLAQALETAEKALHAQAVAVQYWKDASLHPGSWGLTLVTQGGRELWVSVPVSGEVSWEDFGKLRQRPGHGKRSSRPGPRDLAEITRLARKWAAKQLPELKMKQADDGSLTIAYQTRPFMVHGSLGDDGRFAQEVHEVLRPKPGGLVIHVKNLGASESSSRSGWLAPFAREDRYWTSHRDIRHLTKSGAYLGVEWNLSLHDDLMGGRLRCPRRARKGEIELPLDRLIRAMDRLLGPTNEWDSSNRPPVSLPQALEIARGALGEDADSRYCRRFHLHGDQRGDSRRGAWYLYYPANDGTQKTITVGMDGKATVADAKLMHQSLLSWVYALLAIGPLEQAKERLEALCARHGVKASIDVTDSTVTASYRTRRYQVYPWLDNDRRWDTQLQETVGPKSDGFILAIKYSEVPRPWEQTSWMMERMRFTPATPYWHTVRTYAATTNKHQQATLTLQVGKGDKIAIPAVAFVRALESTQEEQDE